MPTNDAIKSLLGTSQGTTNNANANSNPSLKNIATNGALLNQNLSVLIQKISGITKAWGANS
ncbi:MAG TPA: hypothetical protein VHE81_06535 [Lacipirellulaceae bacterium]|jgi:hypothetical protein|nr:hypothetical protein [Lacipirellulaceae bacterium]